MTTKEYLRNIENLNVKIQHRINDIAKLKASVQPATTKIKPANVQESRGNDKVSDVVIKVISLEEEINKLIDKRYEIIQQVESVKPTRLFDILAQKYIECKPTVNIVVKGVDSLTSVKRILKEAEDEFEKMYGELYK